MRLKRPIRATVDLRSKENTSFSVEDLRALRYLAIVLGGVGLGLIWVVGPDEPLVVAGFIAIVRLDVMTAIYGLRRVQGKKKVSSPSPPTTSPDGGSP